MNVESIGSGCGLVGECGEGCLNGWMVLKGCVEMNGKIHNIQTTKTTLLHHQKP